MPATAMPGTSLPGYSHYFGRGQGGLDPKLNFGLMGNGASQQPHPLNANWADKYGVQPASAMSVGGIHNAGLPYANPANEVPKGFRSGDWICSCGFHNYQSRTQVW
jgi:hypothetical protein